MTDDEVTELVDDIAQLAADAAEARGRAAALDDRLATAQARSEADRTGRIAEFDRGIVASWPTWERQLREEEDRARDRFRAAVVADPIVAAWIAARGARFRRMYLANEVNGLRDRYGMDVPRAAEVGWREPRLLEDLVAIAEDAAKATADDELIERDVARQTAGDQAVTP